PMMREPERRETGVPRRAHLRDHLGDAFRDVEALRELRVDEQTDFHDGLSLRSLRAAYSGSALPATGILAAPIFPLKASPRGAPIVALVTGHRERASNGRASLRLPPR